MKRIIWSGDGKLVVQLIEGAEIIKEKKRNGVPIEKVEEVSDELLAEMLEAV